MKFGTNRNLVFLHIVKEDGQSLCNLFTHSSRGGSLRDVNPIKSKKKVCFVCSEGSREVLDTILGIRGKKK